jgi:hypothetical protein
MGLDSYIGISLTPIILNLKLYICRKGLQENEKMMTGHNIGSFVERQIRNPVSIEVAGPRSP